MDQQLIINILLGAIGAAISWWVNSIWGMVKDQQGQINNLHIKLTENYVPRAEIENKLERIFDALDDIRGHRTEHARVRT